MQINVPFSKFDMQTAKNDPVAVATTITFEWKFIVEIS